MYQKHINIWGGFSPTPNQTFGFRYPFGMGKLTNSSVIKVRFNFVGFKLTEYYEKQEKQV